MKSAELKRKTPMPSGKALVRTQPMRASVTVKVLRIRLCEGCRQVKFRPARENVTWCSEECGATVALARLAKEEGRQDRAKREALKGVPDLTREAQEAFNEYVRLRDVGKGCFVCGTPLQIGGVGGGFDAGHIRPRSQAKHLRFDERNVHGQCKHCNAPGATLDHEMRAAAERLLGKEVTDALYADNRVHKWQRDELRQIRDTYRAKVKAMKKELR